MTAHRLSKLELCATQYGIIERIATYLISIDLFRLAKTSKTTWTAIAKTPTRWRNLTSKGSCDGLGIEHRLHIVRKGIESNWHTVQVSNRDFLQWHDSLAQRCGATDEGTESKPCTECGFMVCDECRVHCLYFTDFRSLPGFSYQLLTCLGRLLGLKHGIEYQSSILSDELLKHDQPYYKIRPEPQSAIGELIRINLGRQDVMGVLFGGIVEGRKRFMCEACASEGGEGLEQAGKVVKAAISEGGRECSCTLKSHFLDRWLCFPCAWRESAKDVAYHDRNMCFEQARPGQARNYAPSVCACGTELEGNKNALVFCGWCGGKVWPTKKFWE